MGYIHGETFLQSPGSLAPDLTNNFVVSCVYEDPVYPNDYVFKAQMLPGAKLPDTTLKAKCYGDNANRASRDWSQRNHQSGAHIGASGHRMINQGSGGNAKFKAPLHYKLSRREKQVIRQRKMVSARNAQKYESSESESESESESSSSSSEYETDESEESSTDTE